MCCSSNIKFRNFNSNSSSSKKIITIAVKTPVEATARRPEQQHLPNLLETVGRAVYPTKI